MPWDNAMEPLLNLQEFMKTDPATGPTHKPLSIPELGLRQSVLEDLALKHLYLSGPFSVLEMAKLMRISFEVAGELLKRLRQEQLCQVTGMSGQILNLAITSQGRTRAQELLAQSQYTGPSPVTLTSYVNQVKLQSVTHVDVHPSDVHRAFASMVLDERILWQLGTALNSGAAIFLYGPSGVGKTTIAELLSIERAGLGRLVDHLESRGLVRRSASAVNRRYYVLYLTDAGTALLSRLRPAVAASDKRLAAKIGPRAYQILQRALSVFLLEP